MSARDEVLARLRSQSLPAAALPSLEGDWTRYPDPRARFHATLAEASGSVVTVGGDSTLGAVVSGLEVVRSARVCCSFSPFVAGTRDVPGEPHELCDVDVVIAPAQFGVAENGAVWISGASVPSRAALYLASHLVLLLPIGEVVDNLHQAYERLGPELAAGGFGCFMSGPSKTADIEQALVIGAHGPRSLIVVEY